MDASFGACGGCGKTVRVGAVLYSADARLLCPFCYTKADIAAQQRSGTGGCGAALVGALANGVTFLVQAVASLAAANGAIESTGHDWVALGAGMVAVVCGGVTIARARSRASGGWLAIGALVVLIGGFHLARATGIAG
ncbi:MAG TPA: hypothetical protein VF469_33290 [Kofleriaceae bacterium]